MTSLSGHPASPEIRRLEPDDWQLLRTARLRALRDSPSAFGSTLERELSLDEARWRARLTSSAWFLAEAAGGVSGLVCGYRPEDDPDSMELVSMWVDPSQRRRGLGTRLIARVVELARAERAQALSLWITEGNTAAAACYESAGFEMSDTSQPMPNKPECCEHQMRLQL